jgi:hypothetical protein
MARLPPNICPQIRGNRGDAMQSTELVLNRTSTSALLSKSEVILNLGLIAPNGRLPPSLPTSGKCQFLVHVIHTIHHVLSTFFGQKLRCQTR